MRCYGRARLSDLLGDRVIYRGLRPADAALPALGEIASELGLQPGLVPRKGDFEYACVVVRILKASAGETALSRLVYLGDTRMSDGGAFQALRAAGGWDGRAFICGEEPGSPRTLTVGSDGIYTARAWKAIDGFAESLDRDSAWIGPATAVVIDIDKTLIGARGRNGHVIDRARLRALRATVAEVVGDRFDAAAFERSYDALNRPAYHSFTGDNQDYLAYVCLMISCGCADLDALVRDIQSARLRTFSDLLSRVDGSLPAEPAVAAVHTDVAAKVRAGDPTPFKAFRRREFLETSSVMGHLDDQTPIAEMIENEIVITGEVWQTAQKWRERGALLIGLSDKPDEAAIPGEEELARGALPLHRISTHVVGE